MLIISFPIVFAITIKILETCHIAWAILETVAFSRAIFETWHICLGNIGIGHTFQGDIGNCCISQGNFGNLSHFPGRYCKLSHFTRALWGNLALCTIAILETGPIYQGFVGNCRILSLYYWKLATVTFFHGVLGSGIYQGIVGNCRSHPLHNIG